MREWMSPVCRPAAAIARSDSSMPAVRQRTPQAATESTSGGPKRRRRRPSGLLREESDTFSSASRPPTMQTDASLNLGVTAIANLSAARPLSAPGSRTVSGVVFEATPAGRQPVEGASVGWEALLDTVVSETRSDAAGRYLLCGLPLGRIGGVFAQKTGRRDALLCVRGTWRRCHRRFEITRR